MCACVHARVLLFAEEAERFTWSLCSACLWDYEYFLPPLKAVKCSNKFHVCGCVFALWQDLNNTETLLSGLTPFLTNFPSLHRSIIFVFVKKKVVQPGLFFNNTNDDAPILSGICVRHHARKRRLLKPQQHDIPLRAEKVTDEEFQPRWGISKLNKGDKSEASYKISPAKIVWIRSCLIPPTFRLFIYFLTYMWGCALLIRFILHCNTKHVNWSPYGASCTPCGGHCGTLGSFKAPDHLSNLQQNGRSKESAVSFVALGQTVSGVQSWSISILLHKSDVW